MSSRAEQQIAPKSYAQSTSWIQTIRYYSPYGRVSGRRTSSSLTWRSSKSHRNQWLQSHHCRTTSITAYYCHTYRPFRPKSMSPDSIGPNPFHSGLSYQLQSSVCSFWADSRSHYGSQVSLNANDPPVIAPIENRFSLVMAITTVKAILPYNDCYHRFYIN